MDLGLLQREAAAQIGVALDTYRFWEGNRTHPLPRNRCGVVRFLAYDLSQ
jgi:DNA-binding XRE family transcriptional regulator